MMRVLEFIVALIIVAVVAVVVGFVMPGSGHVERSLVVGKDLRQVFDVTNNYRTFADYSALRALDPRTQYNISGAAYGPGAEFSWDSKDEKVGSGKITIASADPKFNTIDTSVNSGKIVWNLDGEWRGEHKHFTIDLLRQGNTGKLTKVTMSYDVDYGANLFARYSNLYIHGQPDAFLQYNLNGLQNMLSAVPNVDYGALNPYIVQTKPTPVLEVSSQMQRKDGLDGLNEAVDAAVKQLSATAKKLNVQTTGPRIVFTTNYGDDTYTFDVAMPISTDNVTVNGQSYQLAAAAPPALDQTAAASTAPASSGTAAAPADDAQPGSKDKSGRLVVDGNVRALLVFGGPALEAPWNGTAAGVPQTREMLKAYALTHGYKYDEVVDRLYDIEAIPAVKDNSGTVTTYAQYQVFLPLKDGADGATVPAQTPEQEAGIKQQGVLNADGTPASSGSAPAPASTSAAPASASTAAK